MKLYILIENIPWEGSYIQAVFDSKEKAEIYNNTFYLDYDIEEYELNPFSDLPLGCKPYRVALDNNYGVSTNVERSEECLVPSFYPYPKAYPDESYPMVMKLIIYSTSEDNAIIKAREIRDEWLKTNKWPENYRKV